MTTLRGTRAMPARRIPRVLSIAGTDPSGGAGQSADLKTIGALGGYGMSVLTSVLAQNTRGVAAIHVPPLDVLTAQLDAVFDDVSVDAVKIGMVPDRESAEAILASLDRFPEVPVILDPVLVATSGNRLGPAVETLLRLASLSDLLTPNIPELAALSGVDISSWDGALEAAALLATSTGAVVLAKGGHLAAAERDGTEVPDALVGTERQLGSSGRKMGEVVAFEVGGRRVATKNTHGTGCTLSAAMATLRARGMTWQEALVVAKPWMSAALSAGASLEVGAVGPDGEPLGHGPLDHFCRLDRDRAPGREERARTLR